LSLSSVFFFSPIHHRLAYLPNALLLSSFIDGFHSPHLLFFPFFPPAPLSMASLPLLPFEDLFFFFFFFELGTTFPLFLFSCRERWGGESPKKKQYPPPPPRTAPYHLTPSSERIHSPPFPTSSSVVPIPYPLLKLRRIYI